MQSLIGRSCSSQVDIYNLYSCTGLVSQTKPKSLEGVLVLFSCSYIGGPLSELLFTKWTTDCLAFGSLARPQDQKYLLTKEVAHLDTLSTSQSLCIYAEVSTAANISCMVVTNSSSVRKASWLVSMKWDTVYHCDCLGALLWHPWQCGTLSFSHPTRLKNLSEFKFPSEVAHAWGWTQTSSCWYMHMHAFLLLWSNQIGSTSSIRSNQQQAWVRKFHLDGSVTSGEH